MELVDLYNDQREPLGEVCDKSKVKDGKFRISVHVWIVNDKGELLVQQRLSSAHKFPNMWAVTGGSVKAGETSLEGALRELSEELSIKAKKEELFFIASYRRKTDYVDVWLLRRNINIEDLVLQEDEVQAVKWITKEEFEEEIESKKAVRFSYDYYKLYIEPKF